MTTLTTRKPAPQARGSRTRPKAGLKKARADESWDFRKADTKRLTHGIHPYPAMMIPQVAARLISRYGAAGDVLFDPYCGTGTSLLEAKLAGMDAVGTDLNPLARLIASVKTAEQDVGKLAKQIDRFDAWAQKATASNNGEVGIPDFPNIDYWFAGEVQYDLAAISNFIDSVANTEIANFFKVAFSQTIRECSWTKNSEFKLVRMKDEQRKRFEPDAYGTMAEILRRNHRAMRDLSEVSPGGVAKVCSFDTVEGIPDNVIPPESVDLVVTSPPYGDSRTTVAYGQFSRLSNQWLGFHEASRLDNDLMGGRGTSHEMKFGIPKIDDTVAEIARVDQKRAGEVVSFFADYEKSILNVAQVVKPGGTACYVVGNRTVKGVQIPTDLITASFFESNGFTHLESILRNIPNKRMPYKNSPTNVSGVIADTMKREVVVVCQKYCSSASLGHSIETALRKAVSNARMKL